MYFSEMQVRAHRDASRAAELGLTAQDIRSMPWDEYNRLFGYDRPTPAEAAKAALEAQHEQAQPPAPAAPQGDPAAPADAPQGAAIASMDMATYAQFRQQAGIGGREYGVGLFNQSGSWADAARAKAGRSAMAGNKNTVEAPRIEGRYLNHDVGIDQRSATERLSNAANLWKGR